jgi:DNA repair protein RecO (recombination protein O)
MQHREKVYRTDSLVIRRTDFGEADRLLTVLTPERGKLKLLAKGARKPTSRKSGHVELFTLGQLMVAVGRDLDIVTQAETLEPYRELRDDLLRTTYAYYFAELVDAFTAERDENRPVFDLLRDAFGWLCVEQDLALVARYFELHLLGLVGYQPQLYLCGGCKMQLEPTTNYINVGEGSVFCRNCGYDRAGMSALPVNTLKVLRFLQTRDWQTCRLLHLSATSQAEIEGILNRYITYHLERKVKSMAFIHRLRSQMGVGRIAD